MSKWCAITEASRRARNTMLHIQIQKLSTELSTIGLV